mgnify:CR=1 FL=1
MELQFKIKFEQTTGGPDEVGIEPPITGKTTWMSHGVLTAMVLGKYLLCLKEKAIGSIKNLTLL